MAYTNAGIPQDEPYGAIYFAKKYILTASGSVGLVMPESIGTRMPCETLVDVKVAGTIPALQGKRANGERGRARSGGTYGYHHNSGHSSYCYSAGWWRFLRPRTLVLASVMDNQHNSIMEARWLLAVPLSLVLAVLLAGFVLA
ncbi:hypothetical protein HB777_03980 [Mesorhizobium loti]|nr:hypothetical protein HB777_03980 [Mesorhizobium loti]